MNKKLIIESYIIRFDYGSHNGTYVSSNAIDNKELDNMVSKGEIISYETDRVGVKIKKYEDFIESFKAKWKEHTDQTNASGILTFKDNEDE